MAHLTTRKGHRDLVRRLNLLPQGVTGSRLLYQILEMLFSEREASLVAALPIRPFTARQAARRWDLPVAEARGVLDRLADRGLLVDIEEQGEMQYVLPPPMAGFFEFSLMRLRSDIDQKALSQLFYQYMNVEEDFIRELFTNGKTQLGRVFVHEEVLDETVSLHVLDHERASEVIRSAGAIGVGICYCRHKMSHLDRACDAPMINCLTFNTTAESLNRHGITEPIEADRALDLLAEARERNLVQFGENVRERVNFICNCCACCCEAMIAARRFAQLAPVHTSNYLPVVHPDLCDGCGKCARVCPVEAVTIDGIKDQSAGGVRVAAVEEDLCLGCGVCVRSCARNALSLTPRQNRVITPLNAAHRTVVMAIERGKLQNLVFDNRLLWSYRALAAVLGVVLRLPPVQQIMATEQVRSRYLEALVRRLDR